MKKYIIAILLLLITTIVYADVGYVPFGEFKDDPLWFEKASDFSGWGINQERPLRNYGSIRGLSGDEIFIGYEDEYYTIENELYNRLIKNRPPIQK